jgi:hypothetical protein
LTATILSPLGEVKQSLGKFVEAESIGR